MLSPLLETYSCSFCSQIILNLGFLLQLSYFPALRTTRSPSLDKNAVLTEDLQRHLLDAVFVIDQLAFVLGKKGVCKLPNGCGTTSIDNSLYEQRLVDVTHAHLCFEELYDLVECHMNSLVKMIHMKMGEGANLDAYKLHSIGKGEAALHQLSSFCCERSLALNR